VSVASAAGPFTTKRKHQSSDSAASTAKCYKYTNQLIHLKECDIWGRLTVDDERDTWTVMNVTRGQTISSHIKRLIRLDNVQNTTTDED
jgi:hypothetical protein